MATKMEVAKLFSDFISLFYPKYCHGCKRSLVRGEEILCTFCLADLPRMGLATASSVQMRLEGRLQVNYALAFLKFRKKGVVQALMHELKYNNQPQIGVRLGAIYGRELVDRGIAGFDLVVPVPLHPARLRQRGYNQSAKFAEGLSLAMNIPWSETVTMRKTFTRSQTRKSRGQRWENVKDVFAVDDSILLTGRHVLLVDDVITTGATLEACGQHLLRKGCKLSVACIAAAQ